MKQLACAISCGIAVIVLLLIQLMPVSLAEVAPRGLIITEVKIRNDPEGFDEFIEIYNASQNPITLNDYFIEYANIATPIPDQQYSKAVLGNGILSVDESLVLAKNIDDTNLPLSKKLPFSSLSDSGGTLKITYLSGALQDQFVWSATAATAISPIQHICTASNCNITKTQSFTKIKDADGLYIFEDNAWQLASPSPMSSALIALPDPDLLPDPGPVLTPDPIVLPPGSSIPNDLEPATPPDDDVVEDQTPTIAVPVLQAIQITELLPNPAPPASDSTDEYIELYNPNSVPIDIAGYKLQSGNTFSYSHEFDQTIIGAFEYKVFMVTETGNILSNSGGQARLLDSAGLVVAQSTAYDSANDGDAWVLIDGTWQWTTSPTPNATNIMTLPVLKLATAKKSVATPKTSAPKKVAAAKKPAPKSAKPKAAAKVAAAKSSKKTPAAERQVYQNPAQAPASIHTGILVGVGVSTLLYAAYEYRHDAINGFKRFQRYREVRRAIRTQASGR